MFTELLKKIVSGQDLAEDETTAMMDAIMSGEVEVPAIAAFMAALATKGETFTELAGAARSMRRKATRIQVSSNTVVDTCGTGGDGASTFNISTTSAFVVAGCGVTVAKHGNRSVSSKCGSADVLEALGVKLDTHPEVVEQGIEEIGIGFLFAPMYHSAMRFAMPARQAVGIRSIFNMLGPLTNPAGANCQLLGVYDPKLTEMFAEALKLLGARKAYVVHGHDGLDEISICAPTRVSELAEGMVRTFDILPEQLNIEACDISELAGGDAQENAGITKSILEGAPGPRQDVVVVNAGAALVAAGVAEDFKDGMGKAREAIQSGAALDKLEALVKFTQENG
ncbi:anthranilate phosphoribosyltransferase [Desulfatibacillum aliphaticivorans]|uniref:anthranilate phosphoribosyltransferase n=1 Tax=Desulfatibacillum aliphaticivorans TaxID=218208 RepID=UPI00041A3EAE|nr:anthranilate phosphoribosyltransferase [Desulfatibacillum aliphaticivorans]